jgi:tRNA nucleotidyltransferase/poly(A) polymerase
MILTESTQEEEVLLFLKKIIKGTEWENKLLLVGGAVRDEVMGKKPKDLDFVVNGDIDAGIVFSTWLGQKLGNYKENSNPVIYPRYGTAKLSLNRNKYKLPNIDLEFVAPRKETYTKGSRNPDVTNGDLMDETLRRDLTINSLMKNVSTGVIIDLSGKGLDDIKNGVVRTTSNPDVIFNEDPLRMLRAIRFAVKYGFEMDQKTFDGIRKHSKSIDIISKERISDELGKILVSNQPAKGIILMKDTGLLDEIIPELSETIGVGQNKHHNEDVFTHIMTVLSKTPPNLETRLMALFHDIAKPRVKTIDDGEVHFYAHEDLGATMARDILTRLKFSNSGVNIDNVVAGVANHMRLKYGGKEGENVKDKSIRKFINTVGGNINDILDLIHADNESHAEDSSMPNQIPNLRNRISSLEDKVDTKNAKLPIDGNDLIQLGLKPSPLFRKILDAVQDAWYENPDMTKEDALEIVNSMKLENNINEIKSLIKKLINE